MFYQQLCDFRNFDESKNKGIALCYYCSLFPICILLTNPFIIPLLLLLLFSYILKAKTKQKLNRVE